jgi:integrase/recombinase XerD
MTALAPVLEAYFTERLAQRQASPHTVASYRDTFCLLLRYARQRLGTSPSRLDFADLDAPFIGAFLDHLQAERGNSIATRNNRLAAIHSLFAYAALRCPEHAALISRVLAIPGKRTGTTLVSFLTPAETSALLASPDRGNWLGRRDHALILVAVQTGLRVSELTSLTRGDVTLGAGSNLRCRGKGRKERRTPLTRPVALVVSDWLREQDGRPGDPLFPSRTGGRISSDAVADLLTGTSSPRPAGAPHSPARTSPPTRSGTPLP